MLNTHIRDQFVAIFGNNGVMPSPHMTSPAVDSGGLQITTGNLGVGAAPVSQAGLFMGGSILSGATTQYGMLLQPVASSGATTALYGVYSQPLTANSAFTVPSAASYFAASPTKGTGSTITTSMGVQVDAITSGGTSNFGVWVNTPSGASTTNVGVWVQGGSPGIYVNAGGLTVAAGTTNLSGAVQVGAVGSGYAASGALRFASAQSITWRNNANGGDIVFGPDSSDRMVISGAIAVSSTVGGAGGASALPATPAAYMPINYGGTNYKQPLYLP